MKHKHPEAILLSRVGDFYEAYGEDAEIVARALQIALTSKEAGGGQRVAMAGVPHHALAQYLPRLVAQRFIVALAEQLEVPQPNKLVRRDVVRLVTPGTLIEENMLDGRAEQLSRRRRRRRRHVGARTRRRFDRLLRLDGAFGRARLRGTAGGTRAHRAGRDRRRPSRRRARHDGAGRGSARGATRVAAARCGRSASARTARRLFARRIAGRRIAPSTHSGLSSNEPASRARRRRTATAPSRCSRPNLYRRQTFMSLDAATRKHLELIRAEGQNPRATLLATLDRCATSMGSRMLARWIVAPLLDRDALTARQECVDAFDARARSAGCAARTAQRLLRSRAHRAARAFSARDAARCGVAAADARGAATAAADRARPRSAGCSSASRISTACSKICGVRWSTSRRRSSATAARFVPEADAELAECVLLRTDARSKLSELEERERERTGIKGLRIKYASAFGYAIEVSKAHAGSVPAGLRAQADADDRRALRDARTQRAGTRNRDRARRVNSGSNSGSSRHSLERVAARADDLLEAAEAIAEIDVLGVARAVRRRTRDTCARSSSTRARSSIEEGRHPVMEALEPARFVPNDVALRADGHRFILLTGPNMGGKSTYLRQIGLADGHRADRLVRAGKGDDARARRSDLHAHRRRRRSRVGAVDVLPGDGRSGEHPAPQHAPVAAADRRGRPRHRHARRPLDRAGDLRVFARTRAPSADGALRDALSRAVRAGRTLAPRRQLPHHRGREHRPRRRAGFLASRAAGQFVALVRHRGRAHGRVAAGGGRSRPRDRRCAFRQERRRGARAACASRFRSATRPSASSRSFNRRFLRFAYERAHSRRGDDRPNRRRRNHRASSIGRQRAGRERHRRGCAPGHGLDRTGRRAAGGGRRRRHAASRAEILRWRCGGTPRANSRHASDLDAIATLGFRGEGLASIAAVAHSTSFRANPTTTIGLARARACRDGRRARAGCRTRRHARSRRAALRKRAGAARVPAFGRAPNSDASRRGSRVSRWRYPQVAFALRHDGKDVWTMPATGDPRERLAMVFGREASRELLAIDESAARSLNGRLAGFISAPGSDRPDRRMQLLFVNGRLLRSAVMSAAWSAAYSTFTMTGRHPYGVVFLELPPEHVDANVHPTKSDVRLRFGESGLRRGAARDDRDAAGARGAERFRAQRRRWRLTGSRRSRRRVDAGPSAPDAVRAGIARRKGDAAPARSRTTASHVHSRRRRRCAAAGRPARRPRAHCVREHRRGGAARSTERTAARAACAGTRCRAQRGAGAESRRVVRRRPGDRSLRRAEFPRDRDAGRLRRAAVRRCRVSRRRDRRAGTARRARARLGIAGVSFGGRRRRTPRTRRDDDVDRAAATLPKSDALSSRPSDDGAHRTGGGRTHVQACLRRGAAF